MAEQALPGNLFWRARECLTSTDLEVKLRLAQQLQRDCDAGGLQAVAVALPEVTAAGHPLRPPLVHPRRLARRSLATGEGRLALIHAVAHIEFNAVNLACDAVFRFHGLPADYYRDWVRVAAEEAEHFRLLRGRLRAAGRDYGDYPGHNGLWDMAQRTAHDPLVRMALVPRMLEARGLDVTPGMIGRFRDLGDRQMVDILSLILREEVDHVRLGSYWFHYLCRERGLAPDETYFELLENFLEGGVRPPLNRAARRAAGFGEAELDRLERMGGS